MIRSETELNNEIRRRADAQDGTAVALRGVRMTAPRGRALSDSFVTLVGLRTRRTAIESPDVLQILEQNYDQLSWLSGSAADVQR